MKKSSQRTPKYYDGIALTNHSFAHLLGSQLQSIRHKINQRPDGVLMAWSEIVGEEISRHTKAHRFAEGVLTVLVNNATLYSLLRQHEKQRLLRQIQKKFPRTRIATIRFQMGA